MIRTWQRCLPSIALTLATQMGLTWVAMGLPWLSFGVLIRN